MKLSDYVIEYIAGLGVTHVFCISGHGNLHLIDSLGKHPKLKYVSTQHEQGVATAAEAYAKIAENIGAAIVTSGPGGTNAVTGVAAAWLDSVPVLYISGQVNRDEGIRDTKVRQFGVQEINIIDIVRPITKYAVTIKNPPEIRYHMEKALYLAQSGRPGPVWLDIPMDVSHAQIEPDKMQKFVPEQEHQFSKIFAKQIQEAIQLIRQAERPVILAGVGIKRAGAKKEFWEVVEKLQIPVLTTYSGADLIAHDHPLSFGRPGINGMRSANFVIQNSDLLLAIGARLGSTQTSSRPETFARAAKKIIVDIDINELNKNWVKADLAFNVDAKVFLSDLLKQLSNYTVSKTSQWTEKCREWKQQYTSVRPEYHQLSQGVNSFVFLDELSSQMTPSDIYIHDMGSAFSCSMQTFKVKAGQYVSSNYGLANMGYSLGGAIGSWFGRKEGHRQIVVVCGDGGLQMTLHEFQTLAHYNIPVKIFILNNHCYLTIKHSQEAYFSGHFVDSTPESGYSAPDFLKIAQSYGFGTENIDTQTELTEKIDKVLKAPGTVVCDVLMPDDQPLVPKLQARVVDGKYVTPPLEDMYPFLPREEFSQNMLIDPID